jgi:hypothetical protein
MRRLGRSVRAQWVLSALTSAGLLSASVVLPVGCARSARDLTLETLSTDELAPALQTVAEASTGQQKLGRNASHPVEPARKQNWVTRLFQAGPKRGTQDPFLDGTVPEKTGRGGTTPATEFASSGRPPAERDSVDPATRSVSTRTSATHRPTANEIASGSPRKTVTPRPDLAPSPYPPLPGPRGASRPAKARLLPEPEYETAADLPVAADERPTIAARPIRELPARDLPETVDPREVAEGNQPPASDQPPTDPPNPPESTAGTGYARVLPEESTALRESLRLRLEYLAREANTAERLGNRIEAVRLWEMAARIDAAEPDLWPEDRSRPWERVAALTARQGHPAQPRLTAEGKPGHPSVGEELVDLRDRSGRGRPNSNGPSLAAPTPAPAVARQAPQPPQNEQPAERSAPPSDSQVDLASSAPVLNAPAQEPRRAGLARVREIPVDDTPAVALRENSPRGESHPQDAVESTRREGTPSRKAQQTAQTTAQAATPRTSKPASPRGVTQANVTRQDSAAGNQPPSVAAASKAGSSGRARGGRATEQGPSNSVRLAGSSAAQRTTSSRDAVERIERTPDDQGGPSEATRPTLGRDGTRRQRIDPQVASNVARADAIAARADERRIERAKVELLASPPKIDPREAARVADERATQRELAERMRLAAEKAEADARFVGPLIRANSSANVEPVAGSEIRPGQSPAVRSNPGPIVIAAAPTPTSAAAPDPTPAATAVPNTVPSPVPQTVPSSTPTQDAPANSPAPVTPAPELAATAGPIDSAPAPTLAPLPATTDPDPSSGSLLIASAAGPTLLAPPAGNVSTTTEPAAAANAAAASPAAASPVAVAPEAGAAETPAVGTQSTEPVIDDAESDLPPALSWRKFWVPIGGLVTGLVGLLGLGLWSLVERRHYQAGKRPPVSRVAKSLPS